MRRKIYSELLVWKSEKRRKPLIIDGARQVGKTWILKEFGRNEYKKVAYRKLSKNTPSDKVFKSMI